MLDPIIEVHTWSAWRKRLDESGVSQTNFAFGDYVEGIKTLGEAVVVNEFKAENIMVQVGKLKDSNQRFVEFGDNVAETLTRTSIILRKPCLIFSSKDTCLMVQKVRKFWANVGETRGWR